ncbi:hypothetical protein BTUL_0052g00680 [Botrytis tulipae]|uniref:Uncharacterized protein n=1 Tax=Botrytis tulipae TaxID=87230 RepID=A0A4Z1ESZ4_9HELO|nr:hypothetical protein BTUL_0052g00680 [Botrytis tulipae]
MQYSSILPEMLDRVKKARLLDLNQFLEKYFEETHGKIDHEAQTQEQKDEIIYQGELHIWNQYWTDPFPGVRTHTRQNSEEVSRSQDQMAPRLRKDILQEIMSKFLSGECQSFLESVAHIDYKSLSQEEKHQMALKEGGIIELRELLNSIEVPGNNEREPVLYSEPIPSVDPRDFWASSRSSTSSTGSQSDGGVPIDGLENLSLEQARTAQLSTADGNSTKTKETSQKLETNTVSISTLTDNVQIPKVQDKSLSLKDNLPYGEDYLGIFSAEDEYNYDKVDNVKNFYNKKIVAATEESALDQFRELYGVYWEEILQSTLNDERDSGTGYIQFAMAFTQWCMERCAIKDFKKRNSAPKREDFHGNDNA